MAPDRKNQGRPARSRREFDDADTKELMPDEAEALEELDESLAMPEDIDEDLDEENTDD